MPTTPELRPGLPITEGALIPNDPTLPPIPLRHTAIHAAIIGPIADVQVTQQFHNTHTAPVEARYAFPLPQDAAVTDLTLRIGAREIRGAVREREQARAEYDAASAAGQGAALLEQERPNLFAIAVANIQPDEQIEVTLRFQDRVPYDDGAFTLAFPTVVLPRYTPEEAEARRRGGAAAQEPGDRETLNPLTPPLLPEGARDGHTLSVTVELYAGKLAQISSPSHDVDVQTAHGTTTVTLRQADAIPNKDVVLRYRVAGEQFSAAVFTYREDKQPGTVLLMLTPKAELAPADIVPREVLFVFDRSGSMMGDSIVQARNALRACLRALNPGDVFNIFPFDDKVEQLAPEPLPFTQASIDRADAYIAGIEARGGTEILGALQLAMAQPADQERLRLVVFLTDGAVGNEDEVLRELRKSLGAARVFAFGIGSAVNRFLLDKLAVYGRGSVEYLLPGEAIEDAVQRFQNRAAFPVLVDVALDWGAAQVADALPTPLPDLYASQPLVVLARYHGSGAGKVTLSGRTPRGRYEQTLDVEWPAATPDRGAHWAALPRVWARARIDALMGRERDEPKATSATRDEIIGLALAHQLASRYTSLVAIEEPRAEHAARDKAAPVVVPIHLPAGTRREAFEPPVAGGAVFGVMAAAPMMRMAAPAPQRARGGGGFVQQAARFVSGSANTGALPPAPEELARGITLPAAQPDTRAPAERYEAALRFLARTQNVNGSWADAPVATALALLAFVRGGHSDRAGSYRPQLSRAVRWLAEQAQAPVEPIVSLALAELARATGNAAHIAARDAAFAHEAGDKKNDDLAWHTSAVAAGAQGSGMFPRSETITSERDAWAFAMDRPALADEVMAPLQQQGGGSDGAVVPPGRSAAAPDAVLFAATAAGALAWAVQQA